SEGGGSQLVSVTPTSGSIAPGNSDEITVNVDASGVPAGTYNYELVITSNDPVNPTLTVDVTVTVGEGGSGEITFSPSPLVEQLETGATGTETVTITNNSEGPVNYEFSGYADENRSTDGLGSANPLEGRAFPVFSDKNQDRPTPTYTPRRGAGGPDDFGYTWIDSNEPGGPAFEVIDISETGTPVTFSDIEGCSDAGANGGASLVELPFSFPFYGEQYGELWIAADGFLGTSEWTNCVWSTSPM